MNSPTYFLTNEAFALLSGIAHSGRPWVVRALFVAVLCILLTHAAHGQVSPHGPITFECQACHATDSWEMSANAAFTHAATGFSLTGQHKALDCVSCHEGLTFTPNNANCSSCHTDVHGAELGDNCVRCHSTNSWLIQDMVQRHQQTRFPLVGRHATVACQTCHASAAPHQFVGTPTTCMGCHRDDYQNAGTPSHAGFPMECSQCHSVSAFSWKQGFDHSRTAFPLLGEHRTVPCMECHQGGQFRGTPIQCSACHREEFTATVNPNHTAAGFSMECQACHTPARWGGVSYDHTALTLFPLTGAHAPLQCRECHSDNTFAGRSMECYSCHQNVFIAARTPDHVSSGFPQRCEVCHTTMAWRPSSFNHATSNFPLTGAHQAVACTGCHGNNQYAGLTTNCYDCHTQDFTSALNPNHVAGNFAHNCLQCHTTAGWSPATFDHNTTGFPLTGAHVSQQCQGCHVNGNYQLHFTDCYQCHQTDFARPTNPNHILGTFGHNCTPCHTTATWTPSTFNHGTTQFPLTGAHQAVTCNSCHVNNQYQNLPMACWDCHAVDFNATTNPNHVTGNFAHECAQCHSTINWSSTTFDHNTTGFPLTGAHVGQQCQACHVNGNYQLQFTDCYQCHQTVFAQPTNPNHVLGNFGHDCRPCHTTTVWMPSTFNHGTTQFPLTGAHQSVACNTCHVNNQYQNLPMACWDCHSADFNASTNPNHVSGNFNHDCLQCHTTTAWGPATFDHSTTSFSLTGAHVAQPCQACHVNGNYQLVYTECYQCHQTEYQQTTNPNHVSGNFSHDCSQCHSSINWSGASFDHTTTDFPLTGAHITTPCQTCHVNGNYQLQFTDCYQCHQAEFAQPLNPNHVLGNFGHDCRPCHTTSVWMPSTFNHGTTQFPLTGAHQSVTCNSCHINNQYQNLPMACWDCHAADFNGTVNPNHVTGQFNHDCTQCHTTTGWSPATFDHAATQFPLTGAHVATPCQSCHINGNYQLVYTDCYPCHQAEFQQPTDPNHVLGNFAHDCTPCHTTSVWMPSTFNHSNTQFPLTGAHQATPCSQCHINNQYQNLPMACWDCHAADFNGTTNPNHAAGNFNHDCTQCHTTAAWSPATFNHSATNFPLTGAHVATPCQSCHVNGNYQLEYTDCYQCHQPEYQQVTNPNHVTQLFPHDCTPCHSTSAWSPNTMNHDVLYFRIYSGAHRGEWNTCTQCHPTPGNFVDFTCISCHEHNRADMDDEHQGVTGYVYASPACYDCHRNELMRVR